MAEIHGWRLLGNVSLSANLYQWDSPLIALILMKDMICWVPHKSLNSWISYVMKLLIQSKQDLGNASFYKKVSLHLIILSYVSLWYISRDLRKWIDDQNSKFVEREKEAKEKVLAAKDKVPSDSKCMFCLLSDVVE